MTATKVTPGLINQATETAIGAVEMATTAEAAALADSSRAITPAGLAAALATLNSVPAGVIFDYGGDSSTVPSGYLLCSGAVYSPVTYPNLWTAIGILHGGDSVSPLTPDYRGRVGVGKDNMGGSTASRITNAIAGIVGTTLGAVGGSQSMQAHTHNYSKVDTTLNTSNDSARASGDSPVTTATSSTGAGNSQNVQPTIIVNKIIKT